MAVASPVRSHPQRPSPCRTTGTCLICVSVPSTNGGEHLAHQGRTRGVRPGQGTKHVGRRHQVTRIKWKLQEWTTKLVGLGETKWTGGNDSLHTHTHPKARVCLLFVCFLTLHIQTLGKKVHSEGLEQWLWPGAHTDPATDPRHGNPAVTPAQGIFSSLRGPH